MVADDTFILLSRLIALLKSASGPYAIYAGIADLVLVLLEADAVALFEYEAGRDALVLGTARQLSLEAQGQLGEALEKRLRAAESWRTVQQTVADWGPALQQERPDLAPDLVAMNWLLSVPLYASDDTLQGMLCVLCQEQHCKAVQQQVQVSLLGGLAAMALENAQLYTAQRNRADFLTALVRVDDMLHIDQSLDAVLTQITRAITEVLGWETVVITLVDHAAGVSHPAAWRSSDPAFNAHLSHVYHNVEPQPLKAASVWRQPVFQVGRAYYVDHRQPEAAGLKAQLIEFGQLTPVETPFTVGAKQWHFEDLLVLPLRSGSAELGWIIVDRPRDNRRPDMMRIQELELFAEQAARAVVNARVYNEAEHERIRLMSVLNGLADGILAWDEQERLLFCNRQAEALLGLAQPPIPGMALADFLAESPILPRLRDPAWRTGEVELPAARRALEVQITNMPYTGRLAVIRDVTYFREMEQRRLDLLSSLSHDLKNPLSAINFIARLIERSGDLNVRQREYVNRLRSVAQQAVSLTADLLDMARLEAGARMVFEPFALADLLTDVIEDYHLRAEEKRIAVRCEQDEGMWVLGDAARLRQVFDNLIGNAIKYTPEAGDVRIEAGVVEGEAVVCVQDDGIGIDADHLPYVFDRFYRAHPQLKVEGTGLGLSIARTIVERHNGRIWVESVAGKGSSFFVTLPVSRPPAAEPSLAGVAVPDREGHDLPPLADSATSRPT